MPSPILDRILSDIKAAMKARDAERLQALRFLHAQIKDIEVNERREVTDDDIVGLVAKAIKTREESIVQFKKGGRDDLVASEQLQIDVYRAYQPEQLDEAAIEAIVDEVIAATGASSKRDMGKVMKELMPRVRGKADGGLVSKVVNRKLEG